MATWFNRTESSDTQVIYVSSSGSDANDGLSESTPVATPARAKWLARDGFPDHILFKKGDTWGQGLGRLEKSGRSPGEPMVFGTYGSGANPAFNGSAMFSNGGGNAPVSNDNLVFQSLSFVMPNKGPGSNHTGGHSHVDILRGFRDVIFEDCSFRYGQVNLTPFDGAPHERIKFRQCKFLDNYSTSTHTQGLYLGGWAHGGQNYVDDVLIEHCLFDHNGWLEGVEEKNIFSHNLYCGGATNLVVRDTWFFRASSNGMQAREGAIVDGNIWIQNPINIFVVHQWGNERVENNLIMDANHIGSDLRGWGIDIGLNHNTGPGGSGVPVTNNLLVNGPGPNLTGPGATILSNNKAVNYPGPIANDPGPFTDPSRTVASLFGVADLDEVSAMLRANTRDNWDVLLETPHAQEYIREGFDAGTVPIPDPDPDPDPTPDPDPDPDPDPTPDPDPDPEPTPDPSFEFDIVRSSMHHVLNEDGSVYSSHSSQTVAIENAANLSVQEGRAVTIQGANLRVSVE